MSCNLNQPYYWQLHHWPTHRQLCLRKKEQISACWSCIIADSRSIDFCSCDISAAKTEVEEWFLSSATAVAAVVFVLCTGCDFAAALLDFLCWPRTCMNISLQLLSSSTPLISLVDRTRFIIVKNDSDKKLAEDVTSSLLKRDEQLINQ